MLIVGVGAAFFQQASGAEAAVYYTPKILEEAGMSSDVLLHFFFWGSTYEAYQMPKERCD